MSKRLLFFNLFGKLGFYVNKYKKEFCGMVLSELIRNSATLKIIYEMYIIYHKFRLVKNKSFHFTLFLEPIFVRLDQKN